jgi:ubiquinone biosynthesis protein
VTADRPSDRRQNLARLGEIAQVAARHGFGYVFGRAPGGSGEDAVAGPPGTRGKRLRAMLDELGPTFVKFGQLLSTRPDLVPPDILEELRGLQDDARPETFASIREVVEAELGLTVERVFLEFDERPIAAASIGQVHRAVLPSGDEVVVKVQRPDAERRVEADIQLLYQVAKLAKERVRRLAFIDVVGLVDEFGRSIRRELDYGVEARNAEAFLRNFQMDAHVDVPRVHWRYTTSRVLVMERLEGTPLSQLDLAAMPDEDRARLAARLTETWMQMVFVHGFFHADPHPANVLVRGPDHIGLIDFGLVGQLSTRDREAAVRLLLDVLELNAEALPRRLRALGVRYPRAVEEDLADQLGVVLQRYSGRSMADLDARALLGEIFQTVYRLQITLPTRWMLLDKTLATLSGVALQVSPQFNVFEQARPYAYRLLAQRLRPDQLALRLQGDAERYLAAFREYPFQVSELLEEIKDGELQVNVRVEALTQGAERAEASLNRVVLSLVAFGLLVSSAIVGTLAETGWALGGFGLLAVPAALAGFALVAWVIIGIARSGRW